MKTRFLPFFALLMFATSAPAAADLKLCNTTSARIGVSIGYTVGEQWTTEGWWTIAGHTCETLLKGTLGARYYYVHAIDYDRGGEWAGPSFMCVDEKAFLVKGVEDCQKRGFKRSGFFEVDVGEAKDWTIRLTDPGDGRSR